MKLPKISLSKGMSFIKFVRAFFVILVIFSIISSGYNIWQENHQIEPIIEAVGGKLFNPLYNLAEHIRGITTEGLYVNSGHIFSDIGKFFINIYLLIEPIFLLYYSIYYLFLFSRHIIIMDKSRDTNTIIATLFFYFSIVFVYIAKFTDLPFLTPITSIIDIFKILINI